MSLDIKVSIVVLEGEDRGKTFSLTQDRTVLGRSRGDLLLNDKKVSSEHLCFIIENNQLFIEDLASTNGTFVQLERIDGKHALHNLDIIQIGFSKLQVTIVDDLEQFRKWNTPNKVPTPHKSGRKQKATRAVRPDIDQLIDEELKRFSRWDLNQERQSMPSFKKALTKSQGAMQLIVLDGPQQGLTFNLDQGNVVIGRGKADITIQDNDISRNHASIECFAAGQIFIRDMASTNGTFVNKKRVSYTKIVHGDIIQIGSTVMRFVVGDGQNSQTNKKKS